MNEGRERIAVRAPAAFNCVRRPMAVGLRGHMPTSNRSLSRSARQWSSQLAHSAASGWAAQFRPAFCRLRASGRRERTCQALTPVPSLIKSEML